MFKTTKTNELCQKISDYSSTKINLKFQDKLKQHHKRFKH